MTSVFITRPLVTRFGLRGALLLLPILLVLSGFAATVAGLGLGAAMAMFWLVVVMKTLDQSLRYTVDKTSSVTLYQPLPAAQRNQVQTALESIIEPLVGGLAGLLLAAAMYLVGMDARGIVAIMFVVSLTWAFLVLVQDRYYRQALRTAMYARRFGANQFAIDEPEAVAAVKESLASPIGGRVLNALNLADQIKDLDRTPYYRALLTHASPDVRRDVLRRIEALGQGAVPDEWIEQCVAAEFDLGVRAAALRTLAAIDPPRSVEHLGPLMAAPEEAVRREAFVGLLRHGGIEGVLLAGEPLLAALRSSSPGERRFAASVLEGAAAPGFASVLGQLLADQEPSVRTAALRAVAGSKSAPLWSTVVQLLASNEYEVVRTAVDVIVAGGDAGVDALAKLIDDEAPPRHVRIRAARTLGEVGTVKAVRALGARLSLPDREVSDAAVLALRSHELEADAEMRLRLERRLEEALTNAARASAWRATLAVAPLPNVEPVLYRALGGQIERDLRSIMVLLSFLFPRAGLADAWAKYRGTDAAARALVIEAIDTSVRGAYRDAVLAIVEHDDDDGRVAALPADVRPPLQAAVDVPATVAQQPASVVSSWTRAAAVYSIARATGALPNTPALMNEPLCREVAQAASGSKTMLTIEKVLALRNTPIFAAIREEHLVDVAQRAEPVELASGETLFRQGDQGNSMFVLVEGHVRVHAGERTLAQLGPHEVVGEMAAVDPEPRSATVTAIAHTLLLRISNQSLDLLIDHDPDVARGIIRVLCQRLRGAATVKGEAG